MNQHSNPCWHAPSGKGSATGHWFFWALGGRIHSSHCPTMTPQAGRAHASKVHGLHQTCSCWEGGPACRRGTVTTGCPTSPVPYWWLIQGETPQSQSPPFPPCCCQWHRGQYGEAVPTFPAPTPSQPRMHSGPQRCCLQPPSQVCLLPGSSLSSTASIRVRTVSFPPSPSTVHCVGCLPGQAQLRCCLPTPLPGPSRAIHVSWSEECPTQNN